MPKEYEALVAALKLTGTPVAEYAWKTRPEGAYYVVQLDMEGGSLNADDAKQDRSWEGSLDLFYTKLTDRDDLVEEAEEILTEIFGSSWYLNSTQYEHATGMFHAEWVFEALDGPEPDPPDPPTEEQDDGVPDES